ncbi:MAG: hypothetical protein NWQ54_09770 [Paraglaciecola sp.]|uniref:hypothetical protein n=1 Tax=Pseudomonadati TaxID=3379134 RepID=UPI00273DD20D|nr:hypothetical protein [Paraglaciecola sp.]MDP5030061.1 hypothetical protein [Paraglaciecola sp.]MDP5131164.1 hypothetical protein [Paraglaciecola sp.]
MASGNNKPHEQSIANFAALKTAIANGEEESVKSLLGDQSMQELEKSYLLDLAELNGNANIITLLKDISLKP